MRQKNIPWKIISKNTYGSWNAIENNDYKYTIIIAPRKYLIVKATMSSWHQKNKPSFP
jgi:hypothetical protein